MINVSTYLFWFFFILGQQHFQVNLQAVACCMELIFLVYPNICFRAVTLYTHMRTSTKPINMMNHRKHNESGSF